jgi:hypothetical protein
MVYEQQLNKVITEFCLKAIHYLDSEIALFLQDSEITDWCFNDGLIFTNNTDTISRNFTDS